MSASNGVLLFQYLWRVLATGCCFFIVSRVLTTGYRFFIVSRVQVTGCCFFIVRLTSVSNEVLLFHCLTRATVATRCCFIASRVLATGVVSSLSHRPIYYHWLEGIPFSLQFRSFYYFILSLVSIWSLTIAGSLESLKRRIAQTCFHTIANDRWQYFPRSSWAIIWKLGIIVLLYFIPFHFIFSLTTRTSFVKA